MNLEEALKLTRFVKALCPAQAIDEYTPDAWAIVLDDMRFEDAKEAVGRLAKQSPFVGVSEITAEVRRIRAKRISDAPPLTPPPGTEAEQRAWLGEARRRIGDGEQVDSDYGELKTRYLPDLRALMPKVDAP